VKLIASRTEMFSGADLAYLVKKSIISAVAGDREGIKNQDLLDAIKSFKTDNVFGKKPELIV
jgi:ATP-dependent 26S proteasome regulatory subunit